MGVEIEGETELFEELEELKDDYTGGGDWVVGTNVEYSIYLEYGTSKMDAKPFFRPVIAEAKSRGTAGFIRAHTNTTVEALESIEDVLSTFALALERRITEVVTRKGLVDTGTLRISIQAVKAGDVSDLPSAEDIDADATEEVEI